LSEFCANLIFRVVRFSGFGEFFGDR